MLKSEKNPRNAWSGKEDSNLRPLPPEDSVWAENERIYVNHAAQNADQARNKRTFLFKFTGATPESKFGSIAVFFVTSIGGYLWKGDE